MQCRPVCSLLKFGRVGVMFVEIKIEEIVKDVTL